MIEALTSAFVCWASRLIEEAGAPVPFADSLARCDLFRTFRFLDSVHVLYHCLGQWNVRNLWLFLNLRVLAFLCLGDVLDNLFVCGIVRCSAL